MTEQIFTVLLLHYSDPDCYWHKKYMHKNEILRHCRHFDCHRWAGSRRTQLLGVRGWGGSSRGMWWQQWEGQRVRGPSDRLSTSYPVQKNELPIYPTNEILWPQAASRRSRLIRRPASQGRSGSAWTPRLPTISLQSSHTLPPWSLTGTANLSVVLFTRLETEFAQIDRNLLVLLKSNASADESILKQTPSHGQWDHRQGLHEVEHWKVPDWHLCMR